MKLTGKNKNQNKSLIFIIALIWSLIVLFNYLYETKGIRDNTVTLALTEARNSFMNNVIYRKWESLEGGVYVKVSEYTPPNPYLDVKDRDVVTTDGVKLTLVNPAYMTRMVHELQKGKNGIQGHITSLNPIRPENSADAWEKKALRRFEKGTKEFSSFEYINNKKFLRFMSPFITESESLLSR